MPPTSMEAILVEYQEAASSYARGVEIGERSLRGFVLLNFALLGLYSIPAPEGEAGNYLSFLESLAPLIGVFTCLLFFILIRHYCMHLSNTLTRCVDLERYFSGQLYSRNKKISESRFNIQVGLNLGSAFFLVLWAAAGYLQFVKSAAAG